jgi:hypothetical protein
MSRRSFTACAQGSNTSAQTIEFVLGGSDSPQGGPMYAAVLVLREWLPKKSPNRARKASLPLSAYV